MQQTIRRIDPPKREREPVQITTNELALLRRLRGLQRQCDSGTIVIIEIGERLCWRVASKKEG